eukprot:GHVS01014915.1.p1 GENE.GHVS01014915.1~~GHVS01014915.1.p1  ORF type:complete len:134 (-),score=14.45 GHVS01014915.1:69-470(-)
MPPCVPCFCYAQVCRRVSPVGRRLFLASPFGMEKKMDKLTGRNAWMNTYPMTTPVSIRNYSYMDYEVVFDAEIDHYYVVIQVDGKKLLVVNPTRLLLVGMASVKVAVKGDSAKKGVKGVAKDLGHLLRCCCYC